TMRHRAARKAGACAACDEGHLQAMADAQHFAYLRGGFRQRDRKRALAERGETIAIERRAFLVAKQQTMRGQYRRKRNSERCAARFGGCLRLRSDRAHAVILIPRRAEVAMPQAQNDRHRNPAYTCALSIPQKGNTPCSRS